MKCRQFERLLCDYLDGAADFDDRRRLEDHVLECEACSQKLSDAQFALGVISEASPVQPPAELVGSIIRETGELVPAVAGGGSHLPGFLHPLLHPFMHPRFVMSLAMAVLSFSMVAFYGQGTAQEPGGESANAAAVVGVAAEGLNTVWETGIELYETAVLFYRLQTEFDSGVVHTPREETPDARRDDSQGGQPESAERTK